MPPGRPIKKNITAAVLSAVLAGAVAFQPPLPKNRLAARHSFRSLSSSRTSDEQDVGHIKKELDREFLK